MSKITWNIIWGTTLWYQLALQKDLVQRFAGTEVIEKRSSRRISTRILEDTDTTHLGMDMDMLSSSLTQGWFHVLVGSVSIGFMLLLSGLAVYSNYRMTDVVLSLVVTSQGIYVLLFAMEILIVVRSLLFHSDSCAERPKGRALPADVYS